MLSDPLKTVLLPLSAVDSFPQAPMLFSQIREYLWGERITHFQTNLSLPPDAEPGGQIYVTFYQPEIDPLRWGTYYDDLRSCMGRILDRLRRHRSFPIFDPLQTRLLLEYATAMQSVSDSSLLTDENLGPFRFEPGITGLSFRFMEKRYFYMPTEAYTRSHMTLTQAARYLARRVGFRAKNTAAAMDFLRKEISDVHLLQSRSFVSHGTECLELYRGYPESVDSSPAAIECSFFAGVEWLLRNQSANGKFLYFYDASTDSTADFQHPDKPDYYNMLRHSGGTITLLRAHELCSKQNYVEAARRSIEFMLQESRTYVRAGEIARYVIDNEKAKLGGTGLALVALMHFHRLTGDSTYMPYCEEMIRHLLSQICADGEFLGYYIHPHFNNGRPLEEVGEEVKRKLFSFYYPGEALLGIALYDRYAPGDHDQKAEIRAAGRKALDFLLRERPQKYPELFLTLPSDSWLMQAIEEWWHHPEMRDPAAAEFVYSDADRMIDHLYQPHNSPYRDYPGHFFYHYGQHALPDGARAEGLMAAYYLARQEGKRELAQRYLGYCRLIAKGLMRTYNSEAAMYAAKVPAKAVGSFRFKLTRQWVRVDSIQHTACFFARLLPHI